MLESSGKEELSKIDCFIKDCGHLSEYHRKNASNSLNWWNTLSIFNLLLTSSQSLVMICMSIYGIDNSSVAIVGGCYSFAVAIFLRVQNSYNFNVLNVLHNNASDDYLELQKKFSSIEDDAEYKYLVQRFIGIQEKSHIQPVRECKFIMCCC